jgi:hypothetical protein
VWASNVAERVLVAGTDFDLAPDGKRVAVLTPVETPETPKAEHDVVFLLNFSDYLRQRVTAGGNESSSRPRFCQCLWAHERGKPSYVAFTVRTARGRKFRSYRRIRCKRES